MAVTNSLFHTEGSIIQHLFLAFIPESNENFDMGRSSDSRYFADLPNTLVQHQWYTWTKYKMRLQLRAQFWLFTRFPFNAAFNILKTPKQPKIAANVEN